MKICFVKIVYLHRGRRPTKELTLATLSLRLVYGLLRKELTGYVLGFISNLPHLII